jgi:hypothetical protein
MIRPKIPGVDHATDGIRVASIPSGKTIGNSSQIDPPNFSILQFLQNSRKFLQKRRRGFCKDPCMLAQDFCNSVLYL